LQAAGDDECPQLVAAGAPGLLLMAADPSGAFPLRKSVPFRACARMISIEFSSSCGRRLSINFHMM